MNKHLTEADLEGKTAEEIRGMMVEHVQGLLDGHKKLLKIYIDHLKEFIDIAKVLPVTPKPIDKLMMFLSEELERLGPRCEAKTLVPMLVSELQDPVLEKKRKSQDSARSREFERLMKAYHRYQPQLIVKMQNLLASQQAKADALQSKIAAQDFNE